jgi:hypothetical protein
MPGNHDNKNNRLIMSSLDFDEDLHHYCVNRVPDWEHIISGFS